MNLRMISVARHTAPVMGSPIAKGGGASKGECTAFGKIPPTKVHQLSKKASDGKSEAEDEKKKEGPIASSKAKKE